VIIELGHSTSSEDRAPGLFATEPEGLRQDTIGRSQRHLAQETIRIPILVPPTLLAHQPPAGGSQAQIESVPLQIVSAHTQ
jgi:hypothetical protein